MTIRKYETTISDNIHAAKINKDYTSMKECLEFYANIDHYIELHDYKGLHKCEIIGNSPLSDQGHRARKLLKGLSTI
jgi:hypothetical protein